jgi:L-amino acid N-acyltransferase YncA
MDIEKIKNLYPAEVHLKNQQTLHLRFMTKNDIEGILEFFSRIPDEDKHYLQENVSSVDSIKAWWHRIESKRVITILGEIDNILCAEATLHQQSAGWSKHVGDIRINVAHEYRGLGIATALCEKICWVARKVNIEKIMAEVLPEQKNDLEIFKRFGFTQEALLKNHVKDMAGKVHDLIILTNHTAKVLEEIHSHMLYTDPRFGNEY